MTTQQDRLFVDLPLPEGLAKVVKIAGSSKHLAPAQRTFNRLTDQVRNKRETVARCRIMGSGLALPHTRAPAHFHGMGSSRRENPGGEITVAAVADDADDDRILHLAADL